MINSCSCSYAVKSLLGLQSEDAIAKARDLLSLLESVSKRLNSPWSVFSNSYGVQDYGAKLVVLLLRLEFITSVSSSSEPSEYYGGSSFPIEESLEKCL